MCRIYEKYKDYLLTLARALLGDRAAAEDVVHDVFVSFAGSVRTFTLTGSLRGYLSTCVRNLMRDRIRTRRRQAENLDSAASIISASGNPQQRAIETEEMTRLRAAMSKLPYEQREAVVLRLRGDMRFREIARLQNVSVGAVQARYRYGLDKLRSMLNSEVTQ
jgi:RNA polymerase sigma-70 factor (ECF subfamily)